MEHRNYLVMTAWPTHPLQFLKIWSSLSPARGAFPLPDWLNFTIFIFYRSWRIFPKRKRLQSVCRYSHDQFFTLPISVLLCKPKILICGLLKIPSASFSQKDWLGHKVTIHFTVNEDVNFFWPYRSLPPPTHPWNFLFPLCGSGVG